MKRNLSGLSRYRQNIPVQLTYRYATETPIDEIAEDPGLTCEEIETSGTSILP